MIIIIIFTILYAYLNISLLLYFLLYYSYYLLFLILLLIYIKYIKKIHRHTFPLSPLFNSSFQSKQNYNFIFSIYNTYICSHSLCHLKLSGCECFATGPPSRQLPQGGLLGVSLSGIWFYAVLYGVFALVLSLVSFVI